MICDPLCKKQSHSEGNKDCFRREGHIYPSVWENVRRGMTFVDNVTNYLIQ